MMVTYEIYTRLCDGANLRKLGWDQGFMVAVVDHGGGLQSARAHP